MTELAWLIPAFFMGLLGGTHCVGMCGGLSGAFTYALPVDQRHGLRLLKWQLIYNCGRLSTYVLLGVFAGLLLSPVQDLGSAKAVLRMVAGLVMVLLGAYLAGWLPWLSRIEQVGGPLWRVLGPVRQRLLPIQHPAQAYASGLIWGLLPCGLVYGAMALAITQGEPGPAAATMLAFGLGTLPTLLITGTAAGQLRHILQRPGTRRTAGLVVVVFGFWTALGTAPGWMGGGHTPAHEDSSHHHH